MCQDNYSNSATCVNVLPLVKCRMRQPDVNHYGLKARGGVKEKSWRWAKIRCPLLYFLVPELLLPPAPSQMGVKWVLIPHLSSPKRRSRPDWNHLQSWRPSVENFRHGQSTKVLRLSYNFEPPSTACPRSSQISQSMGPIETNVHLAQTLEKPGSI